jgi:perosamine synthetase
MRISLAKPNISFLERAYVDKSLKEGWITSSGPFHKKFEQYLTDNQGRPTIATSSGTTAILLALIAAGVRAYDKVIMPTLTFGTPASCVRLLGAEPVFVDVDENGLMLPGPHFARVPKVVMPTHLYGMKAQTWYGGIPVIEDSCEAFGIVSPTADYTCYSFFANKHITTGEGGALATNKGIDYIRMLRDGGFDEDYDMLVPGLNFCMTEMQAAIGCAQMERLNNLLFIRERNILYYQSQLKGFGKWLFVARVKDPANTKRELAKLGVETRRVFKPLHLSPAFGCKGSFPVAEDIYNHGLCLPTGHVTLEEVDYICDAIKRIERGAPNINPPAKTEGYIPA